MIAGFAVRLSAGILGAILYGMYTTVPFPTESERKPLYSFMVRSSW